METQKLIQKITFLALIGGLSFVLSGCAQKVSAPESDKTNLTEEIKVNKIYQFPGVLPDEKIKNKKAIVKTNKGMIEFELLPDKAPKTVSNFVYLAEAGFYNGLIFHRVVPGFVIQGGDPQGTGAGGPGYNFPDEPVQSDYVDGAVAMANSGPNTNGSQFFICLGNQLSLPKQYNLFGQVTKGLEVVKNIAVSDKIETVTIEDK
jgi:cyclophilin family peptidyl-prolyl cis-trans isomerase